MTRGTSSRLVNHQPRNSQPRKGILLQASNVLDAVRVLELKPYHVTRWLDGHAWNVTTRRCAITAVKRVLNWATDEGYISASPLRKLKKPPAKPREKMLTPDEHRSILATADTMFRLIVLVMRHTGVRPGEVGMVEAENVDLAAGTWTLTKHKTRNKTGKPRTIYLTPCMQTVTRMLLSVRSSGPLFLNSRGRPWTANAIRCRMRRVREKLHLDRGVVAYAYRHTFTTEGLANGVPIATMAELLGHVDTTMISRHYSHLNQKTEHLRHAALLAAGSGRAAGA